MTDENEAQKGFKVADRRRFEADGVAKEDQPEPEPRREPNSTGPAELPAVDFSTFVLSLSTSVMVHMGEAPHPDGAKHKDLTLAKQTIDILGMLKEKTQGNLNDEEDRLLSELLYDLRLRYVAATN